jgi:hypothetical protein
MALGVTNDDDCLETSALTGPCLLLDRFNLFTGHQHIVLSPLLQFPVTPFYPLCTVASSLGSSHPRGALYLHDLILELWQKPVNNLELFDR